MQARQWKTALLDWASNFQPILRALVLVVSCLTLVLLARHAAADGEVIRTCPVSPALREVQAKSNRDDSVCVAREPRAALTASPVCNYFDAPNEAPRVRVLCCVDLIRGTRQRGSQFRCFPTLLLVGVQKAGTTAVFGHLLAHPEFRPPSVGGKSVKVLKEVHFFDLTAGHQPNKSAYLEYFPDIGGAPQSRDGRRPVPFVSADCSPSYSSSYDALKRLRDVLPHARVVLLLRDPVQRAWSELNMRLRQLESQLEWRGLLSQHAAALAMCLDTSDPVQIGACVPSEVRSNPRWQNFLRKKVLPWIMNGSLSEILSDQQELQTEWLYAGSDSSSGVVLDLGSGLASMREEMQMITGCIRAGDTLLRRCFLFQRRNPAQLTRGGYVLRGMYLPQVQNLFELFAREQVLVLFDSELRSNPNESMSRIYAHAGMHPGHAYVDPAALSQQSLQRRLHAVLPEFGPISGWQLDSETYDVRNKTARDPKDNRFTAFARERREVEDELCAFYSAFDAELEQLLQLGPLPWRLDRPRTCSKS
ncbi:Bifunctional heparan sulfate N-deacetylase/N-sulfotransferase 3 [Porphyridium purpureum]|uniref:Bifunctional heparan sulfate N-deacetylase/N-sulfotransferase 3 n=1 Tax=Porphyridium purpureum TaxID=35688 RepID=A0A5J4Z813_PORPP|nr:Bifunctional heparan sulfate N-deacetylase/N-sulfotransferase 3 [Porphyridium purpureum]|eukprot:POR0045..scf295_1